MTSSSRAYYLITVSFIILLLYYLSHLPQFQHLSPYLDTSILKFLDFTFVSHIIVLCTLQQFFFIVKGDMTYSNRLTLKSLWVNTVKFISCSRSVTILDTFLSLLKQSTRHQKLEEGRFI